MYPPDVNEFLSQSGWFSFPGLAHGKQALQHVLAKKMKLSHEVFLGIREAVYLFEYRQGDKVRLVCWTRYSLYTPYFLNQTPWLLLGRGGGGFLFVFVRLLFEGAFITLDSLQIPTKDGQGMYR